MSTVNAYAVKEKGSKLEPYKYELKKIGKQQVDVKVSYCGICHSDLSMMNNDWGMTEYPLVPGHEVVGEVIAVGDDVETLKVGDKVGVGWNASSCMHCTQCMSGEQHLCDDVVGTIVGHHGGFADKVRCHWSWAIPLPAEINMQKAGPLLCGGITVFNSIIISGVSPTDKVGVIGIGGLGHMALKFLNKWGCEVIAFSTSPEKEDEVKKMGATKLIDSTDPDAIKEIEGTLDFIINTTNADLDWDAYLETLAPKGKLHTVGAVLEPMKIPAFSMIMGEKTVGGSPTGSIETTKKMLEFCVRHEIYPIVEEYKLENVNEAIEHVKEGNARYRVVLKA